MWATRVVSGPTHVPRWPHQVLGPIQSVPERFSTPRELVPGQKGGVCWPHGALGGRPAPENQGRSFGVGGAYSATRGALLKIPLRSTHEEGIAACINRARFPKNALFFEK